MYLMKLKAEHRVILKKSSTFSLMWKYRYFYLMLIPVLIWYILFCYLPMYGVTLAFKSFDYSKGILGSPWVGIRNFKDILSNIDYWNAFKNTIIISIGKLIIHFPTPILLAILLNEMTSSRIKKVYQTVFTFPHFISWVVLAGILTNMLGQNGVYNQILSVFGIQASSPLIDPSKFRYILYFSHIWKEIGWDSIIYLAALAGINPEMFEAASMDGVNRFQKIRYIIWPSIRPTVAIVLILTIGQFMSGIGATFDQIFNLYSSPVYSVADTVDTYIYRTSFSIGADFGYMTTAGFIKSVINLVLLYTANLTARKIGEQGLF